MLRGIRRNLTNFGRIQRHFAKPFLKLEKMAEALPLVNKTAELEVKKQLLLNMADVIQCFVCKMPPNTLTIEFFRCKSEKQHLICRSCRTDRKYCCSSRSYETCALVAKLMKEIGLVICRNINNGCQEVKSHAEMLEHEEECQFRFVHCVDSFCNEKIVFLNYLPAYIWKHPKAYSTRTGMQGNILFILDEKSLTKKSSWNWTWIIEGPKKIFVNKMFAQDQLVRIWFYILGSPKEAEHFRYELKIKKESGKEAKFFGKVRSINEDYKTFLESDDTFEMSFGMAKKYLNEESVLEYTFKIRNLKEEAKDEDFESGIDDSD